MEKNCSRSLLYVSSAYFLQEAQPGHTVFVGDGLLSLTVKEKRKRFFFFLRTSLFYLWEAEVALQQHSSRMSSTTYSYWCAQYFCVSEQWCACQCLRFLLCSCMLMHVIAHWGCMDTVRESALRVDSGRKMSCLHRGFEPALALHRAFSVGRSTL